MNANEVIDIVERAIKLVVQLVLSAALVYAGLKIVFGMYDEAVKKAAFGWLGVVIGYWFR